MKTFIWSTLGLACVLGKPQQNKFNSLFTLVDWEFEKKKKHYRQLLISKSKYSFVENKNVQLYKVKQTTCVASATEQNNIHMHHLAFHSYLSLILPKVSTQHYPSGSGRPPGPAVPWQPLHLPAGSRENNKTWGQNCSPLNTTLQTKRLIPENQSPRIYQSYPAKEHWFTCLGCRGRLKLCLQGLLRDRLFSEGWNKVVWSPDHFCVYCNV